MAVAFVALNTSAGLVIDGTQSVLTGTTNRQINAGEHVVVVTGNNGGSVDTQSITVGSLSLTRDKTGPKVNTFVELWSARATADIATSSTITVTLPSTVTACIHAICFSLSGIASTGYFDTSGTGSGNSTSVTSGPTGTTAQNDEIVVAAFRPLAIRTITQTGGYTTTGGEISDATAGHMTSAEYLVLSATGAQTATWTLDVAAAYDSLVGVYKGLPPASLVNNPVWPRVRFNG